MTTHAEELGLPAPFPVALSKTCQAHFEIKAWSKSGSFTLRLFHSIYAAKWFFNLIVTTEYKWLDTRTIVTENGFKVESPQLEEIVEYEFKKREGEWIPPEPFFSEANVFIGNKRVRTTTDHDGPKPIKERVPREPRPDGLIQIGDIAQELNMEPRDARKILRAKNVEKPAHGAWAWPSDMVDKIKKILKGGK